MLWRPSREPQGGAKDGRFVLSTLSFVVCALLLLLPYPAAAERVLKVGLIYSGNGTFSAFGAARPLTAEWLIEQESKLEDGCLKRNGIRVELHTRDIYSTPTLVPAQTNDLVNNVGVSFLMGAESIMGILSDEITRSRDVPLCLPMDATDSTYIDSAETRHRLYPHVFSPMTPASRYFARFFRLAAQKGAKRVAILYTRNPKTVANYWMGRGGIDEARDAGLEVVYENSYDLNPVNWVLTTLEDEIAALDPMFPELIAKDPDVLALSTAYGCDIFVYMTRKYNWRPKGALVTECLNSIGTTRYQVFLDPHGIDELRGVFVPAQWHKDLIGRQFSDDPFRNYARAFPYRAGYSEPGTPASAAQMFSTMSQLYANNSLAWHSLVATDILCSYALFSAACLTNSTDPTQLRLGMQGTLINTFAGPLAFSAQDGINPLKEMAVLQLKWSLDPYAPGELALATDSDYEPFWPLPTFEQLKVKGSRVFDNDGTKITLSILFSLVAIVVIAAVVLLFVFRKRRTIRAMALPLSIMHLLGILVTLASSFLFGYSMSEGLCKARWLVFTIGISLSTTPLSLKLYRVWHIFKPNAPLIKFRISNEQLFMSLALTCGVSAIIVSVVTWLPDHTTTSVTMPNLYDRSSWYTVCVYKNHATELAAAILCAAQIVFCGVMAVMAQVAGVPATYSAALGTGMVAYTNVILGVVFAILELLSDNHNGIVVARMVLINIFALANVGFIYSYPLTMLSLYGVEVEFAGSDTKTANRTRWSDDAIAGGNNTNHTSAVEIIQTTNQQANAPTEKRAQVYVQPRSAATSTPGDAPPAPKVFLAETQ